MGSERNIVQWLSCTYERQVFPLIWYYMDSCSFSKVATLVGGRKSIHYFGQLCDIKY